MRTEEVVVSNPESQVIVGAFDVVETVCVTVRSFIGTVQAFNHLFEWSELFGDSIVVGKSNDLGYVKCEVFLEFPGEFHCRKRVCTVAVSDKLKVFREFGQPFKSHTHGKDAGTDTTVVRHLIADDGTGGSIHDEPDVGFDATDLDVSFVSSEDITFFVRILIYKWLYTDGSGFAVVGDLLV